MRVHGHGPLNSPLVCVELKSGKEMWRHEPEWAEVLPNGREVKLNPARSSLLFVQGKALCLGEYGHLAWLDLNHKGYTELDRTRLFLAHETWTGPVLSKGLLYVVQNSPDLLTKKGARLICYDLRGE
jgi:hypothetical protein